MEVCTPVTYKSEYTGQKGIFLAGPCLRGNDQHNYLHWRDKAIEIFRKKSHEDLVLFLPEPFSKYYMDQILWEEKHLEISKCILFWIPRRMDIMPALTSNIEFGEWMKSGKIVLGYPEDAVHMNYLNWKAKKYNVPISHNLEETVDNALALVYK